MSRQAYSLLAILSISVQLSLLAVEMALPLSNSGLYILFIASALLLWLCWQFSKDALLNKLGTSLAAYSLLEALWAFMMLSAAWKGFVYDYSPLLANHVFTTAFLGALIIKFFWFKLVRHVGLLRQAIIGLHFSWGKWADGLMILVVVLCIYLPDVEGVVALSFVGEQWHHLDYYVMSPGWAVLHGQVPFIDVLSQYGVGFPLVLPRLAEALGGFTYERLLWISMMIAILYYVLMYVFLRQWFGSILLSAAALLIGLRLQMMHYGISPLIWIYPSATAIRLCFDVLFFSLILSYLRQRRIYKLVLAALMGGASLFWMTSTGVAVCAAFTLFLLMLVLRGSLNQGKAVGLLVLSLASAGFLLWVAVGQHIFEARFWRNWLDYLFYFSNLHGDLPIYDSLRWRYHLSLGVGLLIPLLYVFSLFYVGAMWFLRRIKDEYLLVAIIAAYGIVQYTYYVVRSVQTGYDVVALPFVWLSVFWVMVILQQGVNVNLRRIKQVICLVSAYALFTNHNFIAYPNLINVSRNPLVDPLVIQFFPDRQGYFNHQVKFIKEEDKLPVNSLGNKEEGIVVEADFTSDELLKEYVRNEANFSKDAQLIASLVPAGGRAAVLSSFETAILMQAKRASFFYHTPLVTSRPMKVRIIPGDAAHSPSFLADTISQLDQEKPEYVFMERIMLTEPLPEGFKKNNASIWGIIDYIKQHYHVDTQGHYLVALKRKG